MRNNHIDLEELERQKIMKIDDKTSISYGFYKSLENHKDNWEVPTKILYGKKDNVISIENIANFLAKHLNAKLTIKAYMYREKEKVFIKNWIANGEK